MTIRYRHMQPEDVRECAALVAADPVLAARYGSTIADLGTAWLRILRSEAVHTAVFEVQSREGSTTWGVGVSVAVNDEFMREVKTAPFFWIAPELVRRIMAGKSPLLTDKQVTEANSCGGLNCVVWEGYLGKTSCDEAPPLFERYVTLVSAFMEHHRGYRWKEIIGVQAYDQKVVESMMRDGGMFFHPKEKCWVDSLEESPHEIYVKPHLIGLVREIEMRRPGSWIGGLFHYDPPQFGLARSEQRLLEVALGGETDDALSHALGISRSAIKKAWSSIYRRVQVQMPELFPDLKWGEMDVPERGREKKRRLLTYLRSHPEELRPISRRHLKPMHANASEKRLRAVLTAKTIRNSND